MESRDGRIQHERQAALQLMPDRHSGCATVPRPIREQQTSTQTMNTATDDKIERAAAQADTRLLIGQSMGEVCSMAPPHPGAWCDAPGRAETSREGPLMGWGAVEKVVSEASPKERATELVTEDSAAQAFVQGHGGELRYCHDAKAWYRWNGALWQQERKPEAFARVREFVRIRCENESDRVRYSSSRKSFVAAVEKFARTDPAIAVTAEAWDADPFLLGTPGGTVDLKTGHLRRPDRGDYITRTTAVAPAEEATCPLWRTFLDEVTAGDREVMRFLQQFLGYSLTGDIREHALIFGCGPGGNGKGVFVNTFRRILGDSAVAAPMDTFTSSKSERHPTDLAMLKGARFVTASETEKGRPWAEARIKQLAGGDPITARFMRRDFFTFQPQLKLFFIGNHRPVLRSTDDSMRRRFNIVPFTFKPGCLDLQLEEKLRAEWPGIFRWAIDGCLDWQANGLVRPDCVTAATTAYFDEQDLVGQWLQEECDVELGSRSPIGNLFASWSAYAKAAGESPGSIKGLSEELQRRGFERAKGSKGVRIFQGLRLKVQVPNR
jgi:putative DNA primase/helicase